MSPMARKFSKSRGRAWQPDLDYDYGTFRKQHYFFYGSLMDPATLAKVLRLKYRPILQPAHIIGYHCKLWEPYPALLDGPPDNVVYGAAYEVQSRKEKALLEAYEADHYAITACMVRFKDCRKILGQTFAWAQDEGLLKDGTFDLKDLQLENVENGEAQ